MPTGAAGFIGFHVARQLLAQGRHVVGLDNLNSYYDPAPKQARLNVLRENSQFDFVQIDVSDRPSMVQLFAKQVISPPITGGRNSSPAWIAFNAWIVFRQSYLGSTLAEIAKL